MSRRHGIRGLKDQLTEVALGGSVDNGSGSSTEDEGDSDGEVGLEEQEGRKEGNRSKEREQRAFDGANRCRKQHSRFEGRPR